MVDRAIEISESEASERVQRVLNESGFSGFRCDTAFTLYFDASRHSPTANTPGCRRVQLHFEAPYRVGSQEHWSHLVQHLAPEGAAEPAEPVFAYELARMRWSEGSGVRDARIAEGVLHITFQSGQSINIGRAPEGYAWALTCDGTTGDSSPWSLVAEGGRFFARP